jgi:hypothetical protein
MSIIFSLLLLIPSNSNFKCRWGTKSKLPPQAACGVPTWVRLPLPTGAKRFEFRRADNPNLSNYFHRKRDGNGPVKRFSNLINLYRVDLFLCPKDFEKGKTILFRKVTATGVKKMQCRLGEGTPMVLPHKNPMDSSMKAVMSQGAVTHSPDVVLKKRSPIGDSVIKDIIPLPVFKPSQKDAFARFIGAMALVSSLVLLLLLAVVAISIRRKIAILESRLPSSKKSSKD